MKITVNERCEYNLTSRDFKEGRYYQANGKNNPVYLIISNTEFGINCIKFTNLVERELTGGYLGHKIFYHDNYPHLRFREVFLQEIIFKVV